MSAQLGRFDQSFAIRMIRDFLLALTLIIFLELGGRALLAWNHFRGEDLEVTELAAERLASDVRDIMLNSGGPIAARTFYPILQRTYRDRGLEILLQPSASTVGSIQRRFGFTPVGISVDPPEGTHHEVSVDLHAEPFCISCHVTAEVGDVLGTVTVRSYQSTRMGEWWQEARLVSVVGMANVILHTLVLFFLLRLRMEPLLALRSTVARLAKGQLDLNQRTEAKSSDEFGELAHDLNHFLDRVCHLVEDLDGVMAKVGSVNQRLSDVSGRMSRQMESVQERAKNAMAQAFQIEQGRAGPSAEAVEALDLLLEALDARSSGGGTLEHLRPRLQEVLEVLRSAAHRTQASGENAAELGRSLGELTRDLQDDSHYLGEILLLEDRMKVVAESAHVLLDRLRGPQGGATPGTGDEARDLLLEG